MGGADRIALSALWPRPLRLGRGVLARLSPAALSGVGEGSVAAGGGCLAGSCLCACVFADYGGFLGVPGAGGGDERFGFWACCVVSVVVCAGPFTV